MFVVLARMLMAALTESEALIKFPISLLSIIAQLAGEDEGSLLSAGILVILFCSFSNDSVITVRVQRALGGGC